MPNKNKQFIDNNTRFLDDDDSNASQSFSSHSLDSNSDLASIHPYYRAKKKVDEDSNAQQSDRGNGKEFLISQKIGKTSRSIGAPKNQKKIMQLVQAQQKSASFEYTLDGIDGVTINYLLNDNNNTVTIFTADKNTGDIYALNTVSYQLKEKDSIIHDIKEGRYHPNVPVEINGKKYTIPFEYHNNDIVDIAKHYKIPVIQQDNQGQEINDANKTYSFYNANGEKQQYRKELMKNIPLCLINIDGHLSLCDFRNREKPVILDSGFLFEKSINKKVDEERMQMQNNIKNLIGGSPVYIGIAVENENNTDVVKSQLLDETNCVTGLMAILLDGYNPKENINKHLCDMADHLQQVHDGKSTLTYPLSAKESIMSWYLNCHEKLKKDNKYTSIYELQYDKYLDRMIDSSNGERKAKLILIKASGLQFTGYSLGMVLRSGTTKELKKKIKVIKEAKESGLEFTGSALGLALQCGTAKELKKKIKVIKEANASGLQLTGSALGMVLRSGTAKELKKKIELIKTKIGDLPVSWEIITIPLKELEQYLRKLDIEEYKKTIQRTKSRSEKKKARMSKADASDIVVKAILALENLKATHEVDKRVKQDGFSRRVRAQMSADTKVMDKGNDNDSRSKFYKDHKTTIIRNLEKTSSQRKQTQTEIVKLIAFFNQLEDIENKNNRKQKDTDNAMGLLGKRNHIQSNKIATEINDQGKTSTNENTLQVTTEFFSGLSTSKFKEGTKKREIKEDNKKLTKQKRLKSKERMEIRRV